MVLRHSTSTIHFVKYLTTQTTLIYCILRWHIKQDKIISLQIVCRCASGFMVCQWKNCITYAFRLLCSLPPRSVQVWSHFQGMTWIIWILIALLLACYELKMSKSRGFNRNITQALNKSELHCKYYKPNTKSNPARSPNCTFLMVQLSG